MTTPPYVFSMPETYVVLALLFAIDGISHSTAQNVQTQQPLKELYTLKRPKVTPIAIAILKVIVTVSIKVLYVSDSGLANVRVIVLEMVTLVGTRCLVS
jgi:hypothetical protein